MKNTIMKHIKRLFVILSVITFSIPQSYSQVLVSTTLSIRLAPPMLRVYSQPRCPVDGYLWSPGYWAYDSGGYYWVEGEWVLPPAEDLLWTPGYWNYSGGYYGWQAGYWGPHVGFYGGVNYGYGYGGHGYNGGRWEGGHFRYNTAVANVNRSVIHNTYVNRSGVTNSGRSNNRRSFNGPGGISARPSAQEQASREEKHAPPTSRQSSHVRPERTVSESHSSANGKSHTTDAKTSTRQEHNSRTVENAPPANHTSSKPGRESANSHLYPSGHASITNRTPRTTPTNTRTVTQDHNSAPRSPQVQQQQRSVRAPQSGNSRVNGSAHSNGMNRTPATTHANMRAETQTQHKMSNSPHVQQQRSTHAPAPRQGNGDNGRKAGGDQRH